MMVNVALVICVNSKALNTHIWGKMDCVVAKLICDPFMQRCVYAMHATNKLRQMLLTQLFSHVGSQNKPYLKLSVVLIRVTKLFTENTNMASREQIENLVGQKLVTFAI